MTQHKTFFSPVVSCLVVLAILAFVVATPFSHQYFFSTQVADAQIRRSGQARSKRRTQKRASLVPTSFKHLTHRLPKTELDCAYCHTIPSRETPDEIAAATKSSIKGYPYHDSCLKCHRKEYAPRFFTGAAPLICTVCHTGAGPRLTARELGPFPKQNEQTIQLEFPGHFPHDHADHKGVNCADCHKTDERVYLPIPVGASEAHFTPMKGTFKTSPSGHAACFKCHWDKKPTKDNCAGCHLTPDAVAKKPRNVLSANAQEWFKTWPREWPKRLSLKFNHEPEHPADKPAHHDDKCVTCHDLARIETLDLVKAEVSIATCATSNCHIITTMRPSIGTEMYEEDDDIIEGRNNNPSSKLGKHTCTGCHTDDIGSMPPPCSHYLLFGDQYFTLEDFPKSAKQIAEQCKK